MLRVFDELLWVLRREGFPVSTAQALDALRACELVGFGDRDALRDALAAVIVDRGADRARFGAVFRRFFAPEARAHASDLWGRLRDRGFTTQELDALRELLTAAAERGGPGDVTGLLSLAGTESELDHLLRSAGIARALAPMHSPLQAGFYAQQVMDRLGVPRIGSAIRRLADALREALGDERGRALASALSEELDAIRRRVREHVEAELVRRRGEEEVARSEARGRMDTPFYALTDEEIEEVRRAVRSLAERFRGAEQVRRRRARSGRIDPHKTMRRSLRTGGVPFLPARQARRRDKPRLMVLCDISDSVRHASRFMLEFVWVAQDLFARTRSFVFVSEIGETTQLFEREPVRSALARIARGEVVSTAHNSNYGRVLRSFEERFGRAVDRRTTLVILGDGRTNYFADEASVVRRLAARARAVLWLCPEAPSQWATGDSAMRSYAAAATKVLVVRTARELEIAAREVVARRK